MSLALRSFVAVSLMLGFYVLTIGTGVGLLVAAYASVVYSNEIPLRLVAFCVVSGIAILWSVIPRIDRFQAPGPRLDERDHPELFAVLRDVASATGQAMPVDVYLVGDVNAWVAQRGGFMGIGGRRVMGLGLPLLQAVSIAQFRAIIGHEFGHYDSGDTALGPSIYRTRESMGRTIQNLGSSILQKPFLWYGNFFLRVTQAISRAQELAADKLAARIAGAETAASALVATHGASVAYDTYWRQEVVPLLGSGYRPPIAAGFTHFVRHLEDAVRKAVDHEMKEGKAQIYDSHPPLRARVAALEAMPKIDSLFANDGRLASSLLGDLSRAELELLRSLAGEKANTLEKLRWEEAAMRVYLPQWQSRTKSQAAGLAGVTASSLASLANDLPSFARKLELKEVPYAQRNDEAALILGCALAARLHDEGWVCDTGPGRSVVFRSGEKTIEPFSIVPKLRDGGLSADAWTALCEADGIAWLSLARE